MGGAGSAINPEAFKKDARQQKIYNKGINTDNPNEKEIFLKKAGPQLPLAGAVGNIGGLMAQAVPDQLDMGPFPGDYSNMPVIETPAERQEQDFHNFQQRLYNNTDFERLFPNYPVYTPPAIFT